MLRKKIQATGLFSPHFQIKWKRKKKTSHHFNEPLNKFLAKAQSYNLYKELHTYIAEKGTLWLKSEISKNYSSFFPLND